MNEAEDQQLGQGQASLLAFVVAGATLALQILSHRVVSAKYLNNLAFFVIALTMLGFALSGVILTARIEWAQRRLRDVVGGCTAAAVLSTLVAMVLLYRAPVGDQTPSTRQEFVATFLGNLPAALLLAVPFTFCGLILGALLSSPRLDTRRVYGFDLLGSALGALAVVPAIGLLGVEVAIAFTCALLLGSVASIALPRGRVARAALGAAGVAVLIVGVGGERVLRLRYPADSTLGRLERAPAPFGLEHTRWDPIARIEVSRIQPPAPARHPFPCLLGSNGEFMRRFERVLTQNNFAFTYAVHFDGRRESLRGIEETIYAAAYQASSVSRPRALVIGVGGGFDLLTALAFDAREVTGVEVNAATLAILRSERYREYFRAWVEDPRVRLVLADGRHHLQSTEEQFDIIQLSGVDSYAGTAAAAHVFSESYLYTAEAFDVYLSRLTDDGVLNVMRLEHHPPREMLKVLVTAMEALGRRGIGAPVRHLLVVTAEQGNFVALLVKRTPFTPAEVERVRAWTLESEHLRLCAGAGIDDRGGAYAALLGMTGPGALARTVAAYPFSLAPATDDRPFFFRHSFWWHAFAPADQSYGALPVMELSVLVLLGLLSLATVACVYGPLLLLARRDVVRRGSWREGLYFAGAGIGYMAVEIALLQKFGLLLGHPNFALSVVLASLLLWTGVGSLAAPTVVTALGGGIRRVGFVVAALLLAELTLALPLLPRLMGWPFLARVAVVVALVAPLGVCLGTFMPWGLDRLKRGSQAYVPWAWGVNGIFSVVAPVLCVAFSMSWGIDALLATAIPIYLLVGLVQRQD